MKSSVDDDEDLSRLRDNVRLLNGGSSSSSHHHNHHHHHQHGSSSSCHDDEWSSDIVKIFNVNTAKLISIVLILLFVVYHGYLNSFYGRNSCNRLLEQGHLIGYNEWQPSGCMMHKYDKNDIDTCFKYVNYYRGRNNFVFIGDTRIKQLFNEFVYQIDPLSSELQATQDDTQETNSNNNNNNTPDSSTNNNSNNKNQSTNDNQQHYPATLSFKNKKLSLDISYYSKPIMDESLFALLEYYLQTSFQKPSFIIIGFASAYIRDEFTNKDSFESFKGNLSNLIDMVKGSTIDTRYSIPTKPFSQYEHHMSSSDLPIYWMLEDPIDENRYVFNKTSGMLLTNKRIDAYNHEAIKLLYYSPINIWSSSRLVSQGFNADSRDGYELGSFALETDSQMLFNLYCNNRLKFNDASCCSQPEAMSLIQQIIFSLFILSFIISGILFIYRNTWKNGVAKFRFSISGSEISLTKCKNAASSNNFYTLFSALSRLSIIMVYFFACDRANYFMKENKHFTTMTFLIPLLYIIILGLFFHDTNYSAKPMDRSQTDECKGLMQLIFLTYQLSAAHDNTSLFLFIRLITSAYLFLSGYGHFTYFWTTANYSIPRFFSVLFRLNFLPIILCFTMNRMYQFYTFIPMVTFWFVCSYLLMVIYPRLSAKSAKENGLHYFLMIVKLGFFFGFIITLNVSDSLFEKIFMAKPWKFLFVGYDVLIDDWKKRWTLDSYSFAFGMCFGLLISILKRLQLIEETENELLSNFTEMSQFSATMGMSSSSSLSYSNENLLLNDNNNNSNNSNGNGRAKNMSSGSSRMLPLRLRIFLILMSSGGILAYIMFAFLCKSRENCNNVTPYITVIPIVSYFILRNTVSFLRTKVSLFFKWFGKISLEMFVCSFHILLAADSNGILVLLPGQPVLNLLITIFIFISIAHELNLITEVLSTFVVPNNWRICLRNFCSFILLLMPIAIKYGYI